MSISGTGLQSRWAEWLMCAFLALTVSLAHAGSILGLLGSHSGKVAKYEFTLNDSFPVTSVAWSPDGRYIASSSTHDNRIHVWDVQRRVVATELRVRTPAANYHTLAWSADGSYFATCDGSDGILHVYDVRTWILVRDLRPDNNGCLQVVFSSDGKQVAILGARLAVLSTGDWRLLKTSDLRGDWARGNQFLAVAYVPGTYTLLIGGSDHREHPKHIPGQALEMTGVVWILGQDETVPAQHLSSYHIYGNYGPGQSGGAGEVISLAVSPDGEQVATGAPTRNGLAQVTESVHVLRIADGALLAAPLDGQDYGEQHGLAYTSQGRYLIVGHSDHDTRAIHVIDAKTFQIVDVVRSTGFVYDVTASFQRFAAGTGTHIMIWSLPGGR
jgi:WD40 repeat protein